MSASPSTPRYMQPTQNIKNRLDQRQAEKEAQKHSGTIKCQKVQQTQSAPEQVQMTQSASERPFLFGNWEQPSRIAKAQIALDQDTKALSNVENDCSAHMTDLRSEIKRLEKENGELQATLTATVAYTETELGVQMEALNARVKEGMQSKNATIAAQAEAINELMESYEEQLELKNIHIRNQQKEIEDWQHKHHLLEMTNTELLTDFNMFQENIIVENPTEPGEELKTTSQQMMTDDQLRQHKEILSAEHQRLEAEAKDRTEKLHAELADVYGQLQAHKLSSLKDSIAKTEAQSHIKQLQKQLNDKDAVVMPEVVARRLQAYKNRMQQVRTRKQLHNAVMSMLFLGMCLVSCWQPDNADMYWTFFFFSVLFEGFYMQHKIKSEEMTEEQFTDECGTDNVRFYNINFSSEFVATETQIFNRHTRVWMPGFVLALVCAFICLMCHIFSMTCVQEYCSEMLTHVLSFNFNLEDWDWRFRSSDSNWKFWKNISHGESGFDTEW